MRSKIFLFATTLLCLSSAAHAQSVIYALAAGSASGSTGFMGEAAPNPTYFSGGGANCTSASIDTTKASTDGYASLYQCERYGSFTYTLPNLTAGQFYTLNLHFAEIDFGSAGQRQFNVAVNGTQYLTNFDIVAEAGAANRAIVKSLTVAANSSGQIVIVFSAGAAQGPTVSGLEVLTLGQVSSGATTASANVIYQINAGSSSSAGNFGADAYYSGGASASYTSTVDTSGVNNPAPQAVYQTEHYSNMTYTLPNLNAGQVYTVRLHFAENFFSLPGQRQFNVAINGLAVLTNFDIVAATGAPNKAIVKAFPAAANSSGQIVIAFTQGAADIPKVNGIELLTGFRINAGGPGASYWEADEGYNGGGISYQVTNTIDTSQVVDPAPGAAYQSSRYGFMNYIFSNLTPGVVYTLRLHFAEVIYPSAVGLRDFNVAINGTQVLTNFDITGTTGGSDIANVQQFLATANGSGQIVVYFNAGSIDGPIVQALELVGGRAGTVASGQYTISGVVTLGGAGPSAGTAVANATIALNSTSGGQSSITTSASDGTYSFIVSAGGSYTVSASLARYSVGPQHTVTNISANQPNQNFTATLASGGSLAPSSPNKEYIFMNGQLLAIEHAH